MRDPTLHFLRPLLPPVGCAAALALVAALALDARPAASAPAPGQSEIERPDVVETTFPSVDATLAAQWDFPRTSPAPLVVLVPASGPIDRNGWYPGLGEDPSDGMYAQLTRQLVDAGFAVFRYDKPGTGRSSPGRYVTERANAIEAYTRAVDHARIDTDHVFLVGHGLGTDTIAGIFPRFAAVTKPAGVVLLDSRVGETDSVRIKAPLFVINPGEDPDNRYQYGEFVVERRQSAPGESLKTDLLVLDDARAGLRTEVEKNGETIFGIDPRATKALIDWLRAHSRDGRYQAGEQTKR